MATAYVDTSCLIAIAFNETPGPDLARWLSDFTGLVSSDFLEAEVMAAFANPDRGREYNPSILDGIERIRPVRSLTDEIQTVLAAGYLRGADLWHMAVALYYSPEPDEITFLTLDNRQRAVAGALGFQV